MHHLLPFSECTYFFFSQKKTFSNPLCRYVSLLPFILFTYWPFLWRQNLGRFFLDCFLFQLNKVVFKPLSDTFVPTCSKSWSINLINKLFPRSRGCSADAAYQTQFPFSRILRKLWHLGWWRFKRPLINFPFRAILHKFNRIRI